MKGTGYIGTVIIGERTVNGVWTSTGRSLVCISSMLSSNVELDDGVERSSEGTEPPDPEADGDTRVARGVA